MQDNPKGLIASWLFKQQLQQQELRPKDQWGRNEEGNGILNDYFSPTCLFFLDIASEVAWLWRDNLIDQISMYSEVWGAREFLGDLSFYL